MESVGRLAGGVAHDFNNMLGVILGRTELLLQQTPTDESAYAELREIQKAAERSVDLTHQLLAFARKQTAAPKLLDLNPTVGGMLKMIRRLIGEDIDLVWTPDPEPSFVKIDPSQLDQILANLCVNARDAVTEAGRIVISTENVLFEEKDCRDSAERRPGEFVRLSVSDNGSGMDQSALANLFEPFFTTKEVGKGTGLGLATVYGIVKQNEGFIHVDSEPGRGTTFQVFLPRQPEESETSREPSSNVAASQGKETLLLVEDEPSLLAMTATLLRRQGYQVLTASLPSEALRLAERHKGPIHILVTDVVMPEMNGRELAARLPAFSPGIKSLYMSGYTSDIIANHGVLEEGVAFIQKPFTMRELSAKVREVLDKP
jgi:CheY-like chemotaxis protein